MICGEWVVRFLAFTTYPTGNCGVSYLFGSFLVVACIVGSVGFGVLFVPEGLASCASCGVACEGSTVEARSLNHLGFRCLSLIIFGTVFTHFILWCGRGCVVCISFTVTQDGAIITVKNDLRYVPVSR